jgi:hypothetical protein
VVAWATARSRLPAARFFYGRMGDEACAPARCSARFNKKFAGIIKS